MRGEHQTQEAARRSPRQVERRRAEEAAMVSEMIALWCWKHHGGTGCAPGAGLGADHAPAPGSGLDAVSRVDCAAAHGSGSTHRDVRDAVSGSDAEPRVAHGVAPGCGSCADADSRDRIDPVPKPRRDRIDPVLKLHLIDPVPKLHLCPECERLRAYALARIARCPHMATKTFCSVCPTPCYQAQMREQMRAVMRWAGPRMLRYRPWQALRHAWVTLRSKRAASR